MLIERGDNNLELQCSKCKAWQRTYLPHACQPKKKAIIKKPPKRRKWCVRNRKQEEIIERFEAIATLIAGGAVITHLTQKGRRGSMLSTKSPSSCGWRRGCSSTSRSLEETESFRRQLSAMLQNLSVIEHPSIFSRKVPQNPKTPND